jgi:hypothetical protein
MSKYYSVFEASPRLSELHAQLMGSVRSGNGQVQQLMFDTLALFTDECLNAYFLKPVEQFNLNGMGKKIVTGGVSAMHTAIEFALKKVIFKLSKEDTAALAEHIESLTQRAPAGSGQPDWIVVPLTDELYNRIHAAIRNGRANGSKSVEKEFAEALCEVVEVSLHYYFEIPIDKMKMGFLMEKVARLASDTVTSGAKTVIRKVTPTMDDKEMEQFFAFVESFVIPGRQ